MVGFATASSNGYINDYNHIKCVVRCQIKSDVDGPFCLQMVRVDAINYFPNLAPSIFQVFNGRTVRALRSNGSRVVPDN
jgi:hypothetical protein